MGRTGAQSEGLHGVSPPFLSKKALKFDHQRVVRCIVALVDPSK
jgi:hypothetical protein